MCLAIMACAVCWKKVLMRNPLPKCLGGNLGDFGEFCKGLELWRAKQMQDVLHKVEEYADAHGLSKQDVISRINSDASVEMTELNNAFNQAMEHDPDARAAKAKLDRSLNEWINHHENLT